MKKRDIAFSCFLTLICASNAQAGTTLYNDGIFDCVTSSGSRSGDFEARPIRPKKLTLFVDRNQNYCLWVNQQEEPNKCLARSAFKPFGNSVANDGSDIWASEFRVRVINGFIEFDREIRDSKPFLNVTIVAENHIIHGRCRRTEFVAP